MSGVHRCPSKASTFAPFSSSMAVTAGELFSAACQEKVKRVKHLFNVQFSAASFVLASCPLTQVPPIKACPAEPHSLANIFIHTRSYLVQVGLAFLTGEVHVRTRIEQSSSHFHMIV